MPVSLNMTSSSTMVNGELFAVPGATYTFTDSNNQIGNYTASSSYSKVSASISGNTLTVTVAADADPTEIANTTISLNCDSGYDGPVETEWHLYVYESSGQDQVNGDYQRKQAHYNAEPWSIGSLCGYSKVTCQHGDSCQQQLLQPRRHDLRPLYFRRYLDPHVHYGQHRQYRAL